MAVTTHHISTDGATRPSEQPASWSAVYAMSVCAFALIASEFLPVSLLSPMASDLHVTQGMAGQESRSPVRLPCSQAFSFRLWLASSTARICC